jgi:cytochrome c peroxidase
MRSSIQGVVRAGRLSVASILAILGTISACSANGPSKVADVTDESQAVTEDGLADAYQFFRSLTMGAGPEQQFVLGAGHHPIFSTETLKANGITAGAIVTISVDAQGKIFQVDAVLNGIPNLGESFDLWLVKNDKVGGTAKPESGDTMAWIGNFSQIDTALEQKTMSITSFKQPNGTMAPTLTFDPDMVVVTRGGLNPVNSRVLVGDRTLFQKRAWREMLGVRMDDVSGTQANFVESNDPLVKRGAQLFFVEQFGGNGRTCGTCHRIDDNLTVSPKTIATLPQSDPLFVAENNLALATLENKTMLRQRALFTENVDGFDDPTPPLRSANHTFALITTIDINGSLHGKYPADPPMHQTGWGGDGAPGGGTLHEFAFGAIVQHLTKRLNRVAGTDFRIPTQQELDAIEAFQLFTGRQHMVNTGAPKFREATAQRGQALAQGTQTGGKCASCHFEMFGLTVNENFDIGTSARMTDIPADDGFRQPLTRDIPQLPTDVEKNGPLVPGVGLMNIPPLIEAADTGPFFHNNSAQTVEDVVDHYTSDNFKNSRDAHLVGGSIVLTDTEKADIANFLRELNAIENVRQVRKRANFVKVNRSSGNGTILDIAIRDVQDAIDDLAPKDLNLNARSALATVKQALVQAKAQPDANRPPYIGTALTFLQVAKNALLTDDPNNDF